MVLINGLISPRRRIRVLRRGLVRALDRDRLQDDPVLLLLVSGACLQGV